MSTFAERMIGAAKLDVSIYEEVEADRTATGQAMAVVILTSVAAGIGGLRLGLGGLVGAVIAALIAWFLWAFLAFLIGTKLLPEPQTRSDVGELLRTTGFSTAPGMLRILNMVPFLGGIINFAISVWLLITMVIAVRQALDYRSTGRAIIVCLIGWFLYLIIFGGLSLMLGGMGA
jgi:hypothetical protein